MATQYNSKHGIVSKSPYELYMSFVDMRNFVQMLPEDKRQSVQADFDTISVTVQGFNIGVRIIRRQPYSLIMLEDNGAPFKFSVRLYFDAVPQDSFKTDFYIETEADLNLMMKVMLGNKIKQALDKVVDGLVAVSEGRMPEGIDEDMLKNFKM